MALASLFTAVASAQTSTTSTSIAVQNGQSSAQSSPGGTCSLTTANVSVTSAQGVPSGTVTLNDTATSTALGSQTLNSTGQATFPLALANGTHTLVATYGGAATFLGSTSVSVSQTISSQCAALFVVSVSGLSPSNTLTAGQSGTATITVTPLSSYLANLGSSPGFITVSCSGLPNQALCTFSPQNVEILPGQYAGTTSSMVLQTQSENNPIHVVASNGKGSHSVAWAILLPGILGLGGLAWGTRRRAWLSRLSLIALVGLITVLGATACNPHYYYYNHGPGNVPATPAGTYTITVTGQTSNGITAQSQNTTFNLTVQ